MSRLATWNLCLGLINKKDMVLNDLSQNGIDVCCFQETEIDINFPVHTLNSSKYIYESQLSTEKKRVGFYVNRHVTYRRRDDLEVANMHVVVIDILKGNSVRL